MNDDLILKIANNFVNDSFRTHVCLYYDPRVIALACLELSQMFIHSDLPAFNNKPWYEYLNNGDDKIDKSDIDQARKIISEIYKFFEKASTKET